MRGRDVSAERWKKKEEKQGGRKPNAPCLL